ncbi:MAG: hypothetical protein KAH97_04400 [Anaerolineales bacterium]|nr:hypothetical protein [Anaerolineales bacterium]
MKVGKSLKEKELDMWWGGKAAPPHVTTHLCGDGMPTDLGRTHPNLAQHKILRYNTWVCLS